MQNSYVWGAIIAVVIIAGALFIFTHKAAAPGPAATISTSISTSTNGAGTTTLKTGNKAASVPVQATITQSSAPVSGAVTPSLNQPVTYSAALAPDAAATIKADITALRASLKANPAQSDKWLQLTFYYKAGGDYALAEQVWLYMTKAAPTSFVAFADLGDLYNNFLVNYPKAEANYLQAIRLKPDDISNYVNLSMMYKYQYKTNTSAASDIVAQGLKANPNNPTLLQLQAQYKN